MIFKEWPQPFTFIDAVYISKSEWNNIARKRSAWRIHWIESICWPAKVTSVPWFVHSPEGGTIEAGGSVEKSDSADLVICLDKFQLGAASFITQGLAQITPPFYYKIFYYKIISK